MNFGNPFASAQALPLPTAQVQNRIIAARIILVAAIAVGAGLRIWQLGVLGYNTDEAVYAGQAAAIAGTPVLRDLFPIFRAHPLLFQFVLSLIFRVGFTDLAGRLLSAAVGLGAIFVTYKTGKLLYGDLAGAFAAACLAVMPYHVLVSRQVLLDGPETFCGTLALYALARWGTSNGGRVWLYISAAMLGLTILSKETGVVFLGAVYVFLAITQRIRTRFIDLFFSAILLVLVVAPFPISMLLAGGSGTGRNYLVWQLFRRENHPWYFYPTQVPPEIGWAIIAAALLGLVFLWRKRSWRESLLLTWIVVPVAFFQLWPTKGFQYLVPVVPALAILAGRIFGCWNPAAMKIAGREIRTGWLSGVLGVVTIAAMLPMSWQAVQPSVSQTFLAGTGGVPGGREAGNWILKNTPADSTMLVIGPSMANILEFYGHRKAYGLSVSPNPLFRNPSYSPIDNPDLKLRKAEIQYIVWDSFSAARSPFFSEKIMRYVQRYNGYVAHIESVLVTSPDNTLVARPVIIIYMVRP